MTQAVACRHLYLFAIIGLALATALPSAGLAGDAGSGRFSERLFQRIDANGDGVITADEAQAFEQRLFNRLDANHDGVLTQEEFSARRMGRQAAADAPQKTETFRSKRFAAMDANGDGRITADEFAAAFNKRLQALDANGDGRITLDEMKAAGSPI